MATSIRRLARVLALQTLFEVDSVPHDPLPVLQRHFDDNGLSGEGAVFATELVQGVLAHCDDLDKIIAKAAPNWPMDQMAKVDKSVLRMAIYELLYNSEVPLKARSTRRWSWASALGATVPAGLSMGCWARSRPRSRHGAAVPGGPAPGAPAPPSSLHHRRWRPWTLKTWRAWPIRRHDRRLPGSRGNYLKFQYIRGKEVRAWAK